MSRIKLRENLMKLVYDYSMTKTRECDFEVLDLESLTEEEKTELTDNFNKIIDNYDDIVSTIEKNLINYKLDRICKTDLAILIVAIYELNYLKEPIKVVVNEAVELAKKYSLDNSYKFINGLLAKVNNAV